MKMKYKKRYL